MTPDPVVSQPLPLSPPMIEGGRMAEPETGRGRTVLPTPTAPGPPRSVDTREVVVMLHARTSRRAASPRHMAVTA
jgi:hypothetical protein